MLAILAACLVLAGACSGGEPPADLVFRGGAIHTVDPSLPSVEAVAVRDGRIVFVGDATGGADLIGAGTEVVELAGRLLLPGFHDTHVHPVSGGVELGECDLNPATSLEDVERILLDCVAREPGAPWLRGGGFQLPLFPDGAPPKQLLDRLSPDRPAFITSADGHTGWANSRALVLAGVTRATADPPPDGVIVRDAAGEPQGTLRERAMGLVSRHMPPHTDAQTRAGLERALEMAASFGITTLHEASAGERYLRAYQAVEAAGTLSARVIVALATEPDKGAAQVPDLVALRQKFRGTRVQPSAVKIFADGVLEGGTAALLEPYLDRPGFRGQLRWEPDELTAMVVALDQAGFVAHIHAIGDRAIRVSLDAIEAARLLRAGRSGPRHILAHIQLFDPADLPRFQALDVAASFQPLWAYADTYITELTEPRLGPARSRWLYPIRSVVDTGAVVAGGSDWSVTSMNPLPAIEVGVRRRDPDQGDGPVWIPDEQVDLETMIRLYTMGGAATGGLETETGSITPGKAADLVVLDRNLFEIPAHEIGDARVDLTVAGGRVVFRRDAER